MDGTHHTVHHMGRKYLPTKLRGRSSVRYGSQFAHPSVSHHSRDREVDAPGRVLVVSKRCLSGGPVALVFIAYGAQCGVEE